MTNAPTYWRVDTKCERCGHPASRHWHEATPSRPTTACTTCQDLHIQTSEPNGMGAGYCQRVWDRVTD